MENLKTKTVFANSIPLWISNNKIWQIEKISFDELIITNGNDICYAYISNNYKNIYTDRVIYPKYVGKKALELAKKINLHDFYNK